MKAIVFSKDRPMQLDLLLTSLQRNAPGIFEPTVIWFSRKEEFQAGYAICEREHPEATFMLEDGLTYQVRSLLRGGGLVTFFTDDDVLYRGPVSYLPPLGKNWICFSLRLGLNTMYCYPLGRPQMIPGNDTWKWEEEEGDFSYPMSLDGHIFHCEDLLPIIHDRHFATPNWLEVMLMKHSKDIGKPWMSCFQHSCVVGIPANRVQNDMPNRNGNTHPYSVQELNDLYLNGRRVDLDALDFSDIRGAHQEIPLVFR